MVGQDIHLAPSDKWPITAFLSTFALLLGMKNRFENDNDCSIMNFRIRTYPISFEFQLDRSRFFYIRKLFLEC